MGREEVASAFGISRSLAAFHLDKLLDHRLLEARYRRLSGRSGPGAGRPSKMYRPAGEIQIRIPPRDYELAARLLVDASRRGRRGAKKALAASAFEAGRSIGRARRPTRDASDTLQLRRRLRRTLADHGYEPYASGGEVRLRNCPFHALAEDYRDTICPMNLSLIEGILDAMGSRSFEAIPQRTRGECCVVICSNDATRPNDSSSTRARV